MCIRVLRACVEMSIGADTSNRPCPEVRLSFIAHSESSGSVASITHATGVRVLLIEDNEGFVWAVKEAFLNEAQVTVATSLAAADPQLRQEFDVALVDYDLPDGKGDAAVRALLAAQPELPVVAISSHAAGNAALRAAGAVATCAKADFEQLGEVLRRVGC